MTKLADLLLATSLTGCLCGGYAGGGDKVYQRGTDDVLILCENGAFVLTQSGAETDGMANAEADGSELGTLQDTAQVVFTLTESGDTASAPELPGTWNAVHLDMVSMDHANLQCTRLEQATWWPK